MAAAAAGDVTRCINYTALEEAEIIESDEPSDSDSVGMTECMRDVEKRTKGNTTAMAELFRYTALVPPPNQVTRAQVYFGKRVLDPMDPEDLKRILYLNYGPEPGEEVPPTRLTNYPEGKHLPEVIDYTNQPGRVINLVTLPHVGYDPRPPLLLDRVRHTSEFVDERKRKGELVPCGRGTIVDVLGSRGVRCLVEWDRSLPNGNFGGKNTTCDIGYRRAYSLELARTGQNKWEEDVLRQLEDLEWEGRLAPAPEIVSPEDEAAREGECVV